MKTFAFISRHVPTQGQIDLAFSNGISLEHVGDRDAFAIEPSEFFGYDGVVVVHPWSAMRLLVAGYDVGVFENSTRSVDGGPQTFAASAIHIMPSSASRPDPPGEFTTVQAAKLVRMNKLPGTRSCAEGYSAAVGQVIYHKAHDEFLAIGRDQSGVYKIRLESTGQERDGDSTFTVVRA